MASKDIVVLITYVWPESRSSAAGFRDLNLIEFFLSDGYEVHCLSAANVSEFSDELTAKGVHAHTIQLNSSCFDETIKELDPRIVVFDRFISEEQFGWRVEKACPQALRIMDTQDLHFLRRFRQLEVKAGRIDTDYRSGNPEELRELASLYRSDLTLILSDFELQLLKKHFSIPDNLVHLFPFCYDTPIAPTPFQERDNFCFIGNYRHAPNLDGISWFITECWKKIRVDLPKAELHLYGAYPLKELDTLAKKFEGVTVVGSVEDHIEALSRYRVSLAPLRFGAGIKGKILDSWFAGTPVLSTPVGSEGMQSGTDWGGLIGKDSSQLANLGVLLYRNNELWIQTQNAGRRILGELFDRDRNFSELKQRLDLLRLRQTEGRQANFVGSMLRHHHQRSTEYFSRWLEVKRLQEIETESRQNSR